MQHSWNSDKKLLLIILLALSIEIAWLFVNLQILPNPFKSQIVKFETQPAGHVMKIQKDLRKRSLNSLVWENANVDDALYYYDSVLTLSQSTATLYLNDKTEIHLSENTLVTIEPQNILADQQIRLKFLRGDLRASNPFASAKIETPDWSLNLSQGSDISVRQTGKENFEVEVIKGQIQFDKDSTTQALTENQVLKIENQGHSETMNIQTGLQFQGPAYQRIYANHPQMRVAVNWTGEADKIEIIPLGKDRISKTLNPSQKTETLNLELGKYTLRLVSQNKISEAKEIEIWQTPALQLLAPFPRDRVNALEDILFVWSYLPEASEYKVIFTDLKTGKSWNQKATENFYSYRFPSANPVQWKVIGFDSEGFEISSSYSNQIFPIREPLAPPKIKNLEIRIPASKPPSKKMPPKADKVKTSFREILWNSIFPTAFAETESKGRSLSYEAIFAWEPVDGADFYTIEISNSSDFQSPLLSKVVQKTEFIWTGFSPGQYYWRVAGGTIGDRLGIFSEPVKVNLEIRPEKNSSTKSDGVLIRRILDLDSERPLVETQTDEVIKNRPQTQFDETRFNQKTKLISDEERQLKTSYLLEWTPIWTGWTLNGEAALNAKLTSSSMGAGHLQTEQALSREKSYFIDAFYAQYKWKIVDPLISPAQEDQTFTDIRVQVLFGNQKSGLLRGLIVQTVPIVEAKNLDQIEIKTLMTAGPSVYFIWQNYERWKSGHSISLVAGNNVFALSNQNHFRYQFYKMDPSSSSTPSMSLGFRVQEDLVFYLRNFSSGWGAGLSLGYDY